MKMKKLMLCGIATLVLCMATGCGSNKDNANDNNGAKDQTEQNAADDNTGDTNRAAGDDDNTDNNGAGTDGSVVDDIGEGVEDLGDDVDDALDDATDDTADDNGADTKEGRNNNSVTEGNE